MRYTPAGMPVVEFDLGHVSSQEEAGAVREVRCEVACIAMGDSAKLLDGVLLGAKLTAKGFLAAKSLKSRALVLHVNQIEFVEGYENGI